MSDLTRESLNKTLNDIQTAVKDGQTSRGQLDRMTKDLKAQLATQQQEIEGLRRSALQRNVGDSNDDVVRSYVDAYAGDEDDLRRHVATGRRQLDEERGVTFLGNKDTGVVRMFGGTEYGFYEPGLLDDVPKSAWQAQLQERVDTRSLVRQVLGHSPKCDRALTRHLRKGPEAISRVFSDNAGEGAEFIPDRTMPVLQREMELARRLEGLFPSMTLAGGGATINPFLTAGVQMFAHGVPASGDLNPADLPKSVPTTADRSVSPKTFTVVLPADMDAEEDSIIQYAGLARQMLVEAFRDGTEDAIINGDTGTHQDTGIDTWNPRSRWATLGAANDHRKAFVGLRARSTDVSSTSDYNATQSVSAYMSALINLDAPHAFGDVLYLTSPEHFISQILTDSNLLTVDKAGPQATILTGQVASIGGRPLILSEFVTADLAATGLYTGSGALSGMLIVNRARFVMARRRGVRIGTQADLKSHTNYWVGSERKTLHTFDSSTKKNVAWLYNLTAS